ncbi:MAG: hypothetical protein ACFFDN_07700, partial [Candidatus Hodarchaeota archaeon]
EPKKMMHTHIKNARASPQKKPFLLPHTQHFFSRTQSRRKTIIYFTPSAVAFDIINAPEDLVTHIENQEIIQFGGLRNEGFGVVKLIDHIEIDLNDIELPTEATHLTLLSPILYLPKFVEPYDCRHEHLLLWNNGKKNRVKVISAGQFFRLKKNKSIEKIALKGILRKFLFGQFGFGEYILNNWSKEGDK